MHEAEAVCLIKPVLDFFINKEKFEALPTEDEFEMSIGWFPGFREGPRTILGYDKNAVDHSPSFGFQK